MDVLKSRIAASAGLYSRAIAVVLLTLCAYACSSSSLFAPGPAKANTNPQFIGPTLPPASSVAVLPQLPATTEAPPAQTDKKGNKTSLTALPSN